VAEVVGGPRWVRLGVVVVLGLLPHALTMYWVVAAARDGPPDQGNAPLALLYEVPVAAIVFAVAHDFKGRLAWVRPLLRWTTVLAAVAVTAAALLVGAAR
jgi:hypothetical protein